jgi:hAT family C-terminal dimerisation region
MKNEIKSQIHREIDYFSTTTDMWSSRRMTALMALTLHYLTEEFEMRVRHIKCPLEWWKENRFKYPKVAIGARKWLSVCATTTPSERVFSISGLIDTPKRSNLTGQAIFDQVLIHNNWKSLNPSLDRLRQVLN